MDVPRRLAHLLIGVAALSACAPAAGTSGSTPFPQTTIVPGTYTYQPAPLIWQLVNIMGGDVANGAGAVFEWNCAGRTWTIGRIPASITGRELRFGDDHFAINDGHLDARWQPGIDPRGSPSPVCPGPTPTTKTVTSPDAARELVKNTVTKIGPVLVPTLLPDRASATVAIAEPAMFAVDYTTTSGIRVTIRTAVVDVQQVAADGVQRHLVFRGDTRAFYQALDGRATTPRTLLWSEYATKMDAGTPSTLYALIAYGLTEDEFWATANSLQ